MSNDDQQRYIDKIDVYIDKEHLSCLVDILAKDENYEVYGFFLHNHKTGFGGHSQATVKLTKGGMTLILSTRYLEWTTDMDDTFDYTTACRKETLLLEDDPIARNIFQAIKKGDIL